MVHFYDICSVYVCLHLYAVLQLSDNPENRVYIMHLFLLNSIQLTLHDLIRYACDKMCGVKPNSNNMECIRLYAIHEYKYK